MSGGLRPALEVLGEYAGKAGVSIDVETRDATAGLKVRSMCLTAGDGRYLRGASVTSVDAGPKDDEALALELLTQWLLARAGVAA